jgi:DNA primase
MELWRIYLPKHRKKEPKFLSNWRATMLQGAKQLPSSGDTLVVTKALKDVACLYSLGITAIAPNSENLFLTEKQFEALHKRFKNIVIFYDNDLAGIQNMNKFRKKFGVKCFWIPRKYGAKDISDYYNKFGREKTLELIEYAKEKL